MNHDKKRAIQEGIGFGVIAGLVFLMVQLVTSEVMVGDAQAAVRLVASVVMGENALDTSSIGMVWLAAVLVHVVISGAYGFLYGLFTAQLTAASQISWLMHLGLGLLVGFTIWVINFQLIARFAYPWFLDTPQITQALIHTFAYGFPLGLFYVVSERKARGLDLIPHPA